MDAHPDALAEAHPHPDPDAHPDAHPDSDQRQLRQRRAPEVEQQPQARQDERRDAGGLEQVAEPLMRTLNMFRGVVDSGRLRSS